MAAVAARVGKDDLVVLFFAGHGSRIEGTQPGHTAVESIVPADSGRDKKPNRDIPDFEIDKWVQRLNQVTPFVTLIMDCCHSGSVTRDPFSEHVRVAPADSRGFGAWAAAGGGDLLLASEIEKGDARTATWIAGRRQAVVLALAACQARELAWEHRCASRKPRPPFVSNRCENSTSALKLASKRQLEASWRHDFSDFLYSLRLAPLKI